MKIKSILIENFRKLKKISFECNENITTIVGPNGVGKTTILEALRLVKATLLASTDQESTQTLIQMGLFSPHQNSYIFSNLGSEIGKRLIIELMIQIDNDELEYLKNNLARIAMFRLQSKLGQGYNLLNFIGYLSTEQGVKELFAANEEVKLLLSEFEKKKTAQIKLVVENMNLRGENGDHQQLISFLLKKTNFSETLFSVFPADRNFPTGEVPIQFGQSDVNQQILSYSTQPHLKFTRLKNTIISYLLINENDIEAVKYDFKIIFDNLLPGKELSGISLDNMTGRLSVMINEPDTNSTYDIDYLSSGEKGLLLTVFLLLRTIAIGGIALIDEPELHLNPAVLKNIVPFLKKYICDDRDVQIILTTHSAEILASTKEDELLLLLHIINSDTVTPIYKKDNEEAQEAINCLGITTSDLLFNKGVVYLEGNTDEDFINEIFKGLASGYKIQSLGGRGILENEIKTLQSSDKKNELDGYHIFILDFDNKPTKLISTSNVKVTQWDRYSFENYLINIDSLYDIIKEYSKNPPVNRGELHKVIKELAFLQIKEFALFQFYGSTIPQSLSLNKQEITNKEIDEIVNILCDKIQSQEDFYKKFDRMTYIKQFQDGYDKKVLEITEDWESNWKIKCKGKDLLNSIYQHYNITNYKLFVKDIIRSIKEEKREEWQLINAKIEPFLKK